MSNSKIKKRLTAAFVSAIYILGFIAVGIIETSGTKPSDFEGDYIAEWQPVPETGMVGVIRKPDYWYVSAVAAQTQTVEAVEQSPRYELTDEEKRMISIVAWNADYTNDQSLICIIQTIKNRLESPKFEPDTIEGILKQRGQFEPCDKILYNKHEYDFDRIAELIERVWIDEYDPFDGENVLFYSAERIDKNKIAKNLRLVKTEGGTNFYAQD